MDRLVHDAALLRLAIMVGAGDVPETQVVLIKKVGELRVAADYGLGSHDRGVTLGEMQ